jgi:hypothetical protein
MIPVIAAVRRTRQRGGAEEDQQVALDREVGDEAEDPERHRRRVGLLEDPAALDDQHELEDQRDESHGRGQEVP